MPKGETNHPSDDKWRQRAIDTCTPELYDKARHSALMGAFVHFARQIGFDEAEAVSRGHTDYYVRVKLGGITKKVDPPRLALIVDKNAEPNETFYSLFKALKETIWDLDYIAAKKEKENDRSGSNGESPNGAN